MAQLSQYSDFREYLDARLPGCPPALLLSQLRQVARAFCIDTEAFELDLEPISVEDYQQDYTLGHTYNANIQRILSVVINGVPYNPRSYDLIDESILRLGTDAVPHDFDNRLLICATAGSDDAATWAAITDGAVGITIDDSASAIEGLDFSGCDDMYDVALVIQTGLRAERSANVGLVRWWDDHFSIYVDSGSISYLTAGVSGTDISGSAYMNGLTGAGTLGGVLLARVSLRPHLTADDLPDWFLDRWGDTIAAGAIRDLANVEDQDWSSPQLAAQYAVLYQVGRNRALGERDRRYTTRQTYMRPG